MISIDEHQLREVLDFTSLIDAIGRAFASHVEAPERHRHAIKVPGSQDATLLLMPSWLHGQYIGVKTATIFPSNRHVALPSVMATYLLLNGNTGQPLATIEGKTLTVMRTAATSAFASKHLSRANASKLLMVGSGALAGPLIEAHASIRELNHIDIWSRSQKNAVALAARLKSLGLPVRAIQDLESSAREADIISCATLSRTPLIRGSWLKDGTHVDLVGAFTGEMRESDEQLILQSEVFVDTRDGAFAEAGDLIQARSGGDWSFGSIIADLRELATGQSSGRTKENANTVFKSVGCALEDLAAARLAYERVIQN